MENKTIDESAFTGDTQIFGVTSEPHVTFEIFNKDGVGPVVEYSAVRPEAKVCKVTLEKEGAPYTIKFQVHEVDTSQADADDLTGAVIL